MLDRILRTVYGLVCWPLLACAALPVAAAEGPWHVEAIAGGVGLQKPIDPASPLLRADGDWTLHGWLRPVAPRDGAKVELRGWNVARATAALSPEGG